MERTELINKINDYDYMRKLIMENFTADKYRYCSELSELMQEVKKYSTRAEQYNRVPLKTEDFKLFLDGTIARLFKESISRKDALQGNETNKLSQMAFLPESIAVMFFAQDDMKEALSYADGIAVHHLISSGGPTIGTIVSTQLMAKAKELEPEIEKLQQNNSKLEQELEEVRKKQRTCDRNDPKYDEIRLLSSNIRRELSENRTQLYELTEKRERLIQMTQTTLSHAKEIYSSRKDEEEKRTEIIEVDGVVVKSTETNVSQVAELLEGRKQKEKEIDKENDAKRNIMLQQRKYEELLKTGTEEEIERFSRMLESSKKLIVIQDKKVGELRREIQKIEDRSAELLGYTKEYLVQTHEKNLATNLQEQQTQIEDNNFQFEIPLELTEEAFLESKSQNELEDIEESNLRR